jgi:hypothetical protein
MTTWRKGPPPSIGWWPASERRNTDAHRWWNGKVWSEVAFPEDSAKDAAKSAKQKASHQNDIEWTDRPASWPERSKT